LILTVLITRPEPGASETAARLRRIGFEPLMVPCLTVAARSSRLPSPAHVAAVVATSGQAISGLPASFHDLPFFGVGDATARRATAAGFLRVRSADGDAADLLRLVIRECRPADGALLLAVGARQSMALATEFRGAGFRVFRRVVYAAAAAARLSDDVVAALQAGQVRAALFFSAETARAFVNLVPIALRATLADVTALAIGPRAAEVLKVLPWREVRVALRPTQDELLALL